MVQDGKQKHHDRGQTHDFCRTTPRHSKPFATRDSDPFRANLSKRAPVHLAPESLAPPLGEHPPLPPTARRSIAVSRAVSSELPPLPRWLKRDSHLGAAEDAAEGSRLAGMAAVYQSMGMQLSGPLQAQSTCSPSDLMAESFAAASGSAHAALGCSTRKHHAKAKVLVEEQHSIAHFLRDRFTSACLMRFDSLYMDL